MSERLAKPELTEQQQQKRLLDALKADKIILNDKERQAVKDVVEWEKESAKTRWVLGQPIQR